MFNHILFNTFFSKPTKFFYVKKILLERLEFFFSE